MQIIREPFSTNVSAFQREFVLGDKQEIMRRLHNKQYINKIRENT
jgi:hypothetical protein